jgi:K+ transporter
MTVLVLHHATNPTACRVPGLAIFYTQSTSGVPAVMGHLLNNLPALARVSVLLTLRFVPMPYVMPTERFLVRRSRTIAGVYRVIARYGYMEEIDHGAHVSGCQSAVADSHAGTGAASQRDFVHTDLPAAGRKLETDATPAVPERRPRGRFAAAVWALL